MELSSDAKMGIGVLVATVLIIGGGAWYASQKQSSQEPTVAANTERLVLEDSHSLGADDAKVTVVEFGDFECPACGALHQPLKETKEKYADQSVRFVYRQFPLAQHPNALLAAEASEAAAAQGKFWEYHDLLFENQTALEREDLEQYAEQLTLNMDQFREALDNDTYRERVQQDRSDGNAVGVNSTPTVYINGVRYTGQYSVAALSQAIDAALAQ